MHGQMALLDDVLLVVRGAMTLLPLTTSSNLTTRPNTCHNLFCPCPEYRNKGYDKSTERLN